MIVLYDLGLILAAIILQSTLAEFVADLAGAKPDLLLLLAVGFGLFRGKMAGLGYGWVLGLIQDGLSGSLLGQNALSKALIGYVAGILHRNLGDITLIAQLLMVVLATLFDAGLHLGTASLFYGTPATGKMLGTLGFVVIFNAAASPMVSAMVRFCIRRVNRLMEQSPLGRPR
jgi:rod shape-determining protein MreD